jgi:Tol biopolymer transport system component
VPSFQPSWSPDGTMIGYVSGEKGNFDIWVIKVPER